MNSLTASSSCPLFCCVFLVVCVWANLVSSNNTTTITELSPEEVMSKLFNSLSNVTFYNKNLRPYYGGKPVEVYIKLFVVDIYSVSENNMDLTIEIILNQFWQDPRLTFTPANNQTDSFVRLTSEIEKLIWLPDTFIGNSKSLSAQLSISNQRVSFVEAKPTGDIRYMTKLTTAVNCPMDLKYFPVDRQECELNLASTHYTKELILNWISKEKIPHINGAPFFMNPSISLPTFNLKSYNKSTFEYTGYEGNGKFLTCTMKFERSLGYYINQIYVPSFLIVVISWIPFWLDRDHHARVGLGVTTVLTITTLISNTNESLPKVSYIKAMDIYLFVCFLMVFLALIEFAAIGWFESIEPLCKLPEANEDQVSFKFDGKPFEGKPKSSKKKNNKKRDTAWIDKLSRVLFPTVFIIFNLAYVGIFITIKYSE